MKPGSVSLDPQGDCAQSFLSFIKSIFNRTAVQECHGARMLHYYITVASVTVHHARIQGHCQHKLTIIHTRTLTHSNTTYIFPLVESQPNVLHPGRQPTLTPFIHSSSKPPATSSMAAGIQQQPSSQAIPGQHSQQPNPPCSAHSSQPPDSSQILLDAGLSQLDAAHEVCIVCLV
jgi:hypothetical protein